MQRGDGAPSTASGGLVSIPEVLLKRLRRQCQQRLPLGRDLVLREVISLHAGAASRREHTGLTYLACASYLKHAAFFSCTAEDL